MAGVILPAVVAFIALIIAALPTSFAVEIALGLPTVLILVAAAIVFEEDTFNSFLHRSIWPGYLLKYISLPYALGALLLTVAFAMHTQDSGRFFQSPVPGSLALTPVAIVWLWLMAAASFLAGDARIGMIRRERKADAQWVGRMSDREL